MAGFKPRIRSLFPSDSFRKWQFISALQAFPVPHSRCTYIAMLWQLSGSWLEWSPVTLVVEEAVVVGSVSKQ